MKILIFILSICLLVSCSQQQVVTSQPQTNVQNNLANQIEIPKQEKPLEKLSVPTQKIKLPDVKDFGSFLITRNSDKKDENDWIIPPYKEANIKANFSKSAPQVGEKVTVVPLQVKLKPFQLSISNATEKKYKNCVKNKEMSFWIVELESITDKEILQIEPIKSQRGQMPFSVFVIYPSVEFARSLDKTKITKEMIPKDVVMKTIKDAIDLDNDSRPDLLSALFCCGDKLSTYEKCPYLCNKYYKKIGGKWRLFDYDNDC